jgi:NAD(P)-dependent dehydrogenase (short-subunit alcohol dehydrogenase family)
MRRAIAKVLSVVLLSALSPLCLAETVLITGANSGIGLEFTKQFAAKGWTVIATHRHDGVPDTLKEVIRQYPKVRAERMDVTHADEVSALAKKLKGVPIDVLLNNAGIYNDRGNWATQSFGQLDYALFETIMAVNIKGPMLVSETFLPNVKASSQKKIVSISSTNGSLTQQLTGTGAIWYRASKAGLNRAMQLVASTLKPQGITVLLLHPGAVRTEKQKDLDFPDMVETPFTVKNMVETIGKVTLKDTGRFVLYDGTDVPW